MNKLRNSAYCVSWLFFIFIFSVTPSTAEKKPSTVQGIIITKLGDGTCVTGITVQKDGKAIVSASTSVGENLCFALVRYNLDGKIDRSFGDAGVVITKLGKYHILANDMAAQNDGKLVVAGASSKTDASPGSNKTDDFIVARYLTNGRLDSSLNKTGLVITDVGGYHDHAYSVAIQGDGRIVAAGASLQPSMMHLSARYDFASVRYNTDGTLDRGYGSRGKVVTRLGSISEDSARAVAIQWDGKILLAGATHTSRSESELGVVRYNPDGSLDRTFGKKGKIIRPFGTNADRISAAAHSIAVQKDGKILVGVNLYKHGSYNIDGVIIRFNRDGSFDVSFGNGGYVLVNGDGYFMNAIEDVALQNDNKILFTGSAGREGQGKSDIVVGRINEDGTRDRSFGEEGLFRISFGSFYATGRKIAITPNRNILVAGDVGVVDGNTMNHRSQSRPSDLCLLRLKSDGSLY